MALCGLTLFIVAIPAHIFSTPASLSPANNIALAQLGLSARFYVIYQAAHIISLMVGFSLTGLAIFLHKSDDWLTLLVSLAMLLFGVTITPSTQISPVLVSLIQFTPGLWLPGVLIYSLGIGLFLFIFFIFPDGRFVPKWTLPLSLLWLIWLGAYLFSPATWENQISPVSFSPIIMFVLRILSIDPQVVMRLSGTLRIYSLSLVLAVWFGSGALAQIIRFNKFSSPLEKHQTKWVVYGLGLAVLLYFGGDIGLLVADFAGFTSANIMLYRLIAMPIATLGLLLVPITFNIAITRSRLWDVDYLINRTLVYGLVTGLTTIEYFGLVIVFQYLLHWIFNYQGTLSIIITTLLAATLFRPLRNRTQTWVDRRFYRERLNFRQVFTDFARQVRTIIELSELEKVLVQRTTELLHIEHGAVFLRGMDEALRLSVSTSHLPDNTPLELILSPLQLSNLQQGHVLSQPRSSLFPMLVPLLAPQTSQAGDISDTLLGILALGPLRSGLRYSREDQALLISLADQAGTAIYVAQLIQKNQAETLLRQEAERRLEAYRNSPLGRAETLAKNLLTQPAQVFAKLHALANQASSDPDAASLVGNLPKVMDNEAKVNSTASPLANLAEGFNYLYASQFTAELFPLGLRTLITGLEGRIGTATVGLQTNPSQENGLETEINEIKFAIDVYTFSQIAYTANTISQITLLDIPSRSTMPEGHPLSPLHETLQQLHPVAEALHAHERVDSSQDKLAYLASALNSLRHVEFVANNELGSADRSIIHNIAENWLSLITNTMSELQTNARLVCQLLTRNTWQGDVVSLVMNIQNTGRGAALELRISLAPSSDYTVMDNSAVIDRLSPGEEVQVQLRLRPRLSEGQDHFRARFVILFTDPRGPDQVENYADVVHLMTDSGEFQFISNPYVVGTPLRVGSPLFFGREDVVRFIQDTLAASHRNNLVLIGQRRTGKTSLLKQLPSRLDDGYLPVYLDGQTLGLDPGLPNFFLTLATEISFALEDRGFEIEPPELADFQASPSNAFEYGFLDKVRKLIGERHLLIMFDEFEELESAVKRGNLDPSIFGFLRHLVQHTSELSVIFCGTHRIEELASDYWNVLFNISLYKHIGFLAKEEAMLLIQEPVARFSMKYDDLALDKIWRVSAGHPYFLQLLCHSLVNRHNKTNRSYVTIADVNAALDEILASGEAHFVYLWNESKPEERLVLTCITRLVPLTGQFNAAQVMDFLAERDITIERSAISAALHRLALRDILAAAQDGTNNLSDAYRWKLGLLGLWVEKYKSLNRVIDENSK